MAHVNAYSFMFFFGWTRFSVSGYFDMEKNAERDK